MRAQVQTQTQTMRVVQRGRSRGALRVGAKMIVTTS